eukprot:3233846-Lingulodinium_polyedra.AAC.1
MADQQHLRASVEELSITAAAANELHHNMVGNCRQLKSELHLWATDLVNRLISSGRQSHDRGLSDPDNRHQDCVMPRESRGADQTARVE